jgi:hypothetical protein
VESVRVVIRVFFCLKGLYWLLGVIVGLLVLVTGGEAALRVNIEDEEWGSFRESCALEL